MTRNPGLLAMRMVSGGMMAVGASLAWGTAVMLFCVGVYWILLTADYV